MPPHTRDAEPLSPSPARLHGCTEHSHFDVLMVLPGVGWLVVQGLQRERERERGHQSLAGHCPLQGSGSQGSRPGPPRPRRPRPRHRGAVHCCESQPPAGTTQDMGTRPAAQPGTDRNPRGAWLWRCDPWPRPPWLLCRAQGSPGRGGAGAGATSSQSHQQPAPPPRTGVSGARVSTNARVTSTPTGNGRRRLPQATTLGVGSLHGKSQRNRPSPPFYRWGNQVPEGLKRLPVARERRVGARTQTRSGSPGGRGLLALPAPAPLCPCVHVSVCLTSRALPALPSPLPQAPTCSRNLGAAADDRWSQAECERSSGTDTGHGQRRGVLQPPASPRMRGRRRRRLRPRTTLWGRSWTHLLTPRGPLIIPADGDHPQTAWPQASSSPVPEKGPEGASPQPLLATGRGGCTRPGEAAFCLGRQVPVWWP